MSVVFLKRHGLQPCHKRLGIDAASAAEGSYRVPITAEQTSCGPSPANESPHWRERVRRVNVDSDEREGCSRSTCSKGGHLDSLIGDRGLELSVSTLADDGLQLSAAPGGLDLGQSIFAVVDIEG